MKRPHLSRAPILFTLIAAMWCSPLFGATPYKTYVIRPYESWTVLCDQYTVQKGDFIWELLRRRGEIAEDDFPRFVLMLKQLNPHIKNVDKIYPGQEILIPLKELMPEKGIPSADDQVLTIPLIPDILYTTYTVQPGDYLVKIVAAQHGIPVDEIPEGYLATLERINPEIDDVNRIYPGQTIRVPELVPQGPSVTMAPPIEEAIAEATARLELAQAAPPEKLIEEPPLSRMSRALAQMGGKLVESGAYFFPTKGREDVKLDLSAYPVIELEDGKRLLLETGKGLPEGAEDVIRTFWKSLTVVRTRPGADQRTLLDRIFQTVYGENVWRTLDLPAFDDGIQATLRGDWVVLQKRSEATPPGYHCMTLIEDPKERTSPPLRDYLAEQGIRVSDLLPGGGETDEVANSRFIQTSTAAPVAIPDVSDRQTFVADFAKRIGYTFDRRVPVTFQYAGFQVNTMMDLIHYEDGFDVLVDFGTLYCEAKAAMEATGLKVLCIRAEDEALAIAQNVLTAVGIPVTKNPVFFGANRNVFKTVSIAIPGLLATHPDQGKILVTELRLAGEICSFLEEREIRVFQILGKEDRALSLR
jgi:LysM repeat protein